MSPKEIITGIVTHLIRTLGHDMGMVAVYSRTRPDAWQVILVSRIDHSATSLVVESCFLDIVQIMEWARHNLPEADLGSARLDVEVWEPQGRWCRNGPGTLCDDSPFVQHPELLSSLPNELPDGWLRLEVPARLS